MSYRQSDHKLHKKLDKLDKNVLQTTQGSVKEEIELIKQALDSVELGYAIQSIENEGENDKILNHLRR